MGGIRFPPWLEAHNVGEQQGYQSDCHADSALGAISYEVFKQQLVPVVELDHSQLDIMARGNSAGTKLEYTQRFRDLLARTCAKVTTPAVVVVKKEANTAGHLLETGPHTDLASTPEAQVDALVHGHRVFRGLQLFEAWGSGMFERLGGLDGAVELVFISSGIQENDSSHSLHYDDVNKAVDKQHAKLDTWPSDPTRLFPDDALSPLIIEQLQATLQEMPKGKPVVIPANNDYDSLVYSLVRGADLFILMMGSLFLGGLGSRFFLVKQVLAELGLVNPVQALLFKAATQCDYMEDSKSAYGVGDYDSLAERFKGVAQGDFSVQRALDASRLTTPMAMRGFLFAIGTDLAMPGALRLPGLRGITLTTEDDELFDGYGLPGIPAGRRGLEGLAQRSALKCLHDMTAHINLTGNGLLMSTGISATAAFKAGQGKPPPRPTSYQLALEAVQQQQQQLMVGGPLAPGFIAAHQAHTILQRQGAMPVATLVTIVQIPNPKSWQKTLSGLQEHLPADVRFYTAVVPARLPGRGSVWVALSQQQLDDVIEESKAAERGMAREQALRALEQISPALEQSKSGALPVNQVIRPQQQADFYNHCSSTYRTANFQEAFFGTLKERGVVVSKARVYSAGNSWREGLIVAKSQEAATALRQQNEARFQRHAAEQQAKLQAAADEITQQLEQSATGILSLTSLNSMFRTSKDFGHGERISGVPLPLTILGDIAAANMLQNVVLFRSGKNLMLARSLHAANHLLKAQGQDALEYRTAGSRNAGSELVKIQDALRASGISPFALRRGSSRMPIVVALNDAVLDAQHSQAVQLASRTRDPLA